MMVCILHRQVMIHANLVHVDEYAVLDGDFRVRGVQNLRVIDASSWPIVPGYFVTTPFYMVRLVVVSLV